MKRRYFLILLLLLLAVLLGGCGGRDEAIRTLADMKGRELVIGAPDDLDAMPILQQICPDAKYIPQNDALYGLRSVSEGKTDAYVTGRYYLERAIQEGNVRNVVILDEPVHTYECALGLSLLCKIPDFENTVNACMTRMLSDGTIDDMHDRWFDQQCEKMPDITLDGDAEYTLNAVTYGQAKPYSFFYNGSLTGFDVELLYRLCEENHWALKLSQAEYSGMGMGLATGKYDIISANLYVTKEREDNVAFSIPYETQEISVAVRGESFGLEFSTPEELKNAARFGIMSGTVFDTYALELNPQAEILYYQSLVDCALALSNGKIDATIFDAPSLRYIAASTEGVELMPEYIAQDSYHFIMPKNDKGKRLQEEFNAWLGEQKRSGELERLYDFWCSDAQPEEALDFGALPDANGTIRIITDSTSRPDVYYYNNALAGYPLELMYRFCREKGYGAKVIVSAFESSIPSLLSDKADICVAFISYTEERAESVLFTDAVLDGGIGVLVRTVKSADDGARNTFAKRFQKTFIAEKRWKLIASGLGVSCLITLGGFMLANLLGAAFCAFSMSRRGWLRLIAEVVNRVMQGTPMVVILMILYYVIFGKSDISGVWVAIIAFGLASGASLAQQFRGAIESVDRGQTEAALSIGFTKLEAFTGIVFPQAARMALPGYFSEFISLMKGTAIVGYIAVIDLTRSGDLIRSSTYDAFFPLLSVALIYFLIAFGILSLLKRVQKKLAPKRVGAQEAAK